MVKSRDTWYKCTSCNHWVNPIPDYVNNEIENTYICENEYCELYWKLQLNAEEPKIQR